MLGSRVAAPAALVRTLKLLVQALPAAPALLGRAGRRDAPVVEIVVAVVGIARPAPAPGVVGRSCGGHGVVYPERREMEGAGAAESRRNGLLYEDLSGHGCDFGDDAARAKWLPQLAGRSPSDRERRAK
jgi:hypothetical protein